MPPDQLPAKLPLTAYLRPVATLALLACAHSAAAQDSDAPDWSFSGFGTAGYAHASERHADYTSSILKAYGAGRSRAWSPDVDSRIGAQLTFNLDRQWSGVVQMISEQNLKNNYRPHVEWAYIKYQATPDLALRVGRIALPMFLAADYRKAAYAYPWVRTPVEVYGAIPISHSDGVDLSYRWHVGPVKNVTQAFYGRYSQNLFDNTHLDVRSLEGITNTTEYGALTARLSYARATLTFDYARPVFDSVRLFGPAGVALAEQYDVSGKRVDALTYGLNYDPGNWFLMGEWGHTNARSYLGKTEQRYISGGYRVNNFTPYLAYSNVRAKQATNTAGLDLTGLPAPLAAQGAQLNGYLNRLLSAIPQQDTVTAGVRWDVLPSIALKLQYDRVHPRNGSSGMLINVQPGEVINRPVHVVSVVLDFVF